MAWSAGNIYFYDGTVRSVNADTTGPLLSSSEPEVIYFDLSDSESPTALDLHQIEQSTYYSTYFSETTGILCIAEAADSPCPAKFLPSYGKEPLILADQIDVAGLLICYDQDDGERYEIPLGTHITGGKIYLWSGTSGTSYESGDWYDEGGILLDATNGLQIYGNTATWHTGVGTYIGCITADGSTFFVWSNQDLELNTADDGEDIEFVVNGSYNVFPTQHLLNNLGVSADAWDNVYADKYYGKSQVISDFQDHDDIGMLRSIKHKPEGKLDINSFPEEITEPFGTEEAGRQARLDKLDRKVAKIDDEAAKLKEFKEGADDAVEVLTDELDTLKVSMLPRALKSSGLTSKNKEERKQARILQRKQDELNWFTKKKNDIEKQQNQNKESKDRILKRKKDEMKRYDEVEPVRGIDMLNWQSLLTGSIIQLADRFDALEARLNGQ